jgi:general secretion pathway protein J
MRRAAGFTLIEMMVVFAVFALIGVVSSQIISRVIANQQLMRERGDRLVEVQRAMQILQRDIMQMIDRPVRDQLGDSVDSLQIGSDGLIEFSRSGWRNPLGLPRSDLQRVGYLTQDGELLRLYWRVLDRTPDSEPVTQTLLTNVEQVEFFALDASGNQYSFWPQGEGGRQDEPGARLAAIVLRIDIPPFGLVERLWPVPAL